MGGIRWVQEGKSIYSETERGDITEFSEKGDICWMILVYIDNYIKIKWKGYKVRI